MQELKDETLVALQGGRDSMGELGCFLWVTELAVVVGVGFMGGGLLGGFALGLALGALGSGSSPC